LIVIDDRLLLDVVVESSSPAVERYLRAVGVESCTQPAIGIGG